MPHCLTVSCTKPILHPRVTIGRDPNSVMNSEMTCKAVIIVHPPHVTFTEKISPQR